MKKFTIALFLTVISFSLNVSAQNIQTNILVQIVKAEDERRFDKTLETLIKSANVKIRLRSALAAGRIGDDKAIPRFVESFGNRQRDESSSDGGVCARRNRIYESGGRDFEGFARHEK